MLIKRARIQNFRCIEDAEVFFDSTTTFIGPNGVGKSTVLRALDWFFNGDRSSQLNDDDVFSGATDGRRRISVEVEFHKLSAEDREALEKYASPGVDTAVIWRRWEDGADKITGKALAYPAFEEVRAQPNATTQRKAYTEIRAAEPALGLPTASSAAAVEEAMSAWERQHLDQLEEAEIVGTNFFGFAGQAKLSGIFDFVLVTADLRASEEAQDAKGAILGRILERAVDRSAADSALMELSERLQGEQDLIHQAHFGPQLAAISQDLSDAVRAFTSGRSVRVTTREMDLRPARAQFRVSVLDDTVETQVDRQGHGFQRTLLISALKLLAQRGATSENNGVICLAIEEPELFQHPVQARAFALVLRRLAEDADQRIQVCYATHSPYFVEPRNFNQVRRITRTTGSGPAGWGVRISHVTRDDVRQKLASLLDPEKVERQLDGVCLTRLADALFAEKVVLVEGETDQAVIEGSAERDSDPLSVSGIVVAPVGTKTGIFLAHAIVTLLGIPCYVAFDGDKGGAERSRQNGQKSAGTRSIEKADAKHNRDLLKYLGGQPEDWPATQVNEKFAVFEDTLETQLHEWWLAFLERKDELIESEQGFRAKNSQTYRHAATTAAGEIPDAIAELLTKIRSVT